MASINPSISSKVIPRSQQPATPPGQIRPIQQPQATSKPDTPMSVTLKHAYEIAKVKQSDPYCQYMSLESICNSGRKFNPPGQQLDGNE
ncbi:hypothetical protein ACLOJK_007254 [Asimina triloba]